MHNFKVKGVYKYLILELLSSPPGEKHMEGKGLGGICVAMLYRNPLNCSLGEGPKI